MGIEDDYNQFKPGTIDSIDIKESALEKISNNLEKKIKNTKESYNLNLLDCDNFVEDVVL